MSLLDPNNSKNKKSHISLHELEADGRELDDQIEEVNQLMVPNNAVNLRNTHLDPVNEGFKHHLKLSTSLSVGYKNLHAIRWFNKAMNAYN